MNITTSQLIGMNIKALREERRLTAKEFGKQLGERLPKTDKTGKSFIKPWSASTVYMMEAGKRAMAADEMLAVADILNVNLMALYDIPGALPLNEIEHVGNVTIDSYLNMIHTDGESELFMKIFHAAVQILGSIRRTQDLYKGLIEEVKRASKDNNELMSALRDQQLFAHNRIYSQLEEQASIKREPLPADPQELKRLIDSHETPLLKATKDILEENEKHTQ
ncbi:helix-turn-helix domain-containing protein [Auritidibacter sp. NML100628]|uniref:helix-turn-helix domain-containing protein n=1 Tax=Auritidibacter sp. NML100628 TaxID=2170742 RepID=UPI000D72697C|nr:helix-turn-helix transcriptional regulator [Auritidibacter sp. NML100628]PXA77921.1 hypothetical protein DCC24_03235 [Auritidibacter sp. NML100628]